MLSDEPALYKRAAEFFEDARTGQKRALILESVLVECVYVLTKFYKVPRADAAEKLTGILHYKGITNKDKPELIAALAMFAQKNLDIVDCVLCAKSKGYKIPVFTFDKAISDCGG